VICFTPKIVAGLSLALLFSLANQASAQNGPPAGAPPPPCAPGLGTFDFEADLQGGWVDNFAALAFRDLVVDRTRALCGGSSARMEATFNSDGNVTVTRHRPHEVGEFMIKVGGSGGVRDFSGMTVEAGIMVDGPSDVRPEALIFLVSDAKWVPGTAVTLVPGRWTTLRHQFGAINVGTDGESLRVNHTFKIAIFVQCLNCRPWQGAVNVDAIRWYPGGAGVAAAPAPAPPPPPPAAPTPPAQYAPPPAAPPSPPQSASPPPAQYAPPQQQYASPQPGQYYAPPSAAQTGGPLPGAPPAPPAALRTDEGASPPRAELNVRVGLKLPGEISPVNWFRTETKTAPLVGADIGWGLASHFSLGAYSLFSPFSFDRMSGSEKIGEGSGIFVSGGAVVKARLALSDALMLRGGATFGLNGVSYHGQSTEFPEETFELFGFGLQVGATAEASYRFSRNLGVVVNLGFFSQPFVSLGRATVKGYPTNATAEGEHRDFAFAPILMTTVGVEYAL
jgi:hypothetical protein